MTKAALRKHIKQLRSEVNTTERAHAAALAAQRLQHFPLFQSSQHIACYAATSTEFATDAIIEIIWRLGKHCYLPVVTSTTDKQLAFVEYVEGEHLQAGYHDILEPNRECEFFPIEKIELIILPLVAFDHHGARLGTGSGYYDKTLECLRDKKDKTFLLGLGYELQHSETIPKDHWDINLDAVLTEKDLYFF